LYRSMRLGLRPNEPSSLLTRPAALLAQKGFSEQINSSQVMSKVFFQKKARSKPSKTAQLLVH
jgi:hypothetical protein